MGGEGWVVQYKEDWLEPIYDPKADHEGLEYKNIWRFTPDRDWVYPQKGKGYFKVKKEESTNFWETVYREYLIEKEEIFDGELPSERKGSRLRYHGRKSQRIKTPSCTGKLSSSGLGRPRTPQSSIMRRPGKSPSTSSYSSDRNRRGKKASSPATQQRPGHSVQGSRLRPPSAVHPSTIRPFR